ncbi:amino acid permease [Angomonas deanei]|uniref:Transmembrane amino acid transporter protein, putative n=1 Tax=Angomonas deanei TaxID=59799 RepID=A0A7G2CL55_9TRYP|nr:amino acid permease [Angomonas deanei]CAD2218972.1 Transmembrane amino acid transporter protein, putative [Angomonas deanei]|eukprot:EPY30049.1 amino acid permease [Angomonas deanei]
MVFSFGCCVGYVVSVMDLFKPIFDEASMKKPDNKSLKYFASTDGRRLLAFLIWLVFMVPLVIPRHIDTLRFASFAAIMFMVYFCIIIIVHSCLYGLKIHKEHVVISHAVNPTGEEVYLFRTGSAATYELGTFCFSYICQVNAVEVFWDMRPEVRNVNGFTKAGALGIMICTIIYIMVSIFGYFDFGADKLGSNSLLLLYNPLEEPEVMIAYIGVLIKLIVAYALLHLGCRNSVYYMIGWTEKYREERATVPVVEATLNSPDFTADDIEQFKSEVGEGDEDHHRRTFVDNIPLWRHLVAVVALSGVILVCGLFIPNIGIVFGFAGSICGGFLGFIFPALILMYSGDFSLRKVGLTLYIVTYVLLISGVCAVVFGTGAAILKLV